MTEFDTLKSAAQRVDAWAVQYGLLGEWKFDAMGVRLDAQYGGNTITRVVDWAALEQSVDPSDLLKRTEESVLRGLSD
tara:strand:+ start:572 stop:805 length:234 start_codon:yes stop_codon:yes gene_type:complete